MTERVIEIVGELELEREFVLEGDLLLEMEELGVGVVKVGVTELVVEKDLEEEEEMLMEEVGEGEQLLRVFLRRTS